MSDLSGILLNLLHVTHSQNLRLFSLIGKSDTQITRIGSKLWAMRKETTPSGYWASEKEQSQPTGSRKMGTRNCSFSAIIFDG